MAKRPLYDLLPRNSEIHNFTSLHLTDRQAKVLGLGLKFRPTLKPPDLTQFNVQIQDFCRSVRLHKKFEGEPADPDFNPRLYVKSTWNPPREDPDLEDKLHEICKDLRQNIKQNKPHWSRNLSALDREEINQIKRDETVRVLATDKNLGPALVSTDWLKIETLRQLNDRQSYSIISNEEWIVKHGQVISTRDKLMSTFNCFITPNAAKFLRSYDHFSSPTKFYIIPKIHKTPMVGRPIAASHSYITRPLSIFVDEYVKPRLKMPTVLRDSGELVQTLESLRLPPHCFLVTADVVSLYPNVDTKKALVALDLLLREAMAPETPLLIQFSRLVFENNFLKSEFSDDIFHQTFEIAMGTPFAVTAANAFMYYLEKDLVTQFSRNLLLYKRFIDDIFFIWEGPKETLLKFLSYLNNQNDRIKLTYVIDQSSISFLDLFLYKDANFSTLQFTTYQKPLNKYLYIPFESFHPTSNKKAFIKGELMRYARNSSTFKAFSVTRYKFWKRLRLRGYPVGFLLPLFREVKYINRTKWFSSSNRKSRSGSMVVFKSTFNCSHASIKRVIQTHLPDLDCIVSYKSTTTLAHICK